MNPTCAHCRQPFTLEKEDLAFLDKIAPSFGGKKETIPPPTHCPLCRLQRRLAFRNNTHIYIRASSSTGKQMFSMFPPDTPFPVIEKEEWWGGSWDARKYGQDIDFSRTFLDQFIELRNKVPHPSRAVVNGMNCDYCNNASEIKDCYLVFNTSYAEGCISCENVWGTRDCIDCTRAPDSELCYDCVECSRCYQLQNSECCENCSDGSFLLNCTSCKHCIGCVNLKHKEFCIFNEQKTKEEYESFVRSLKLDSYSARQEFKKKVTAFWLQHPRPHTIMRRVENTTGNFVFNAKDVHRSFYIKDGESIRYSSHLNDGTKDVMDNSFMGIRSELLYECAICGYDSFNLLFCNYCWPNCSNCLYCWFCTGCDNCFGCVGLQKQKYCIFNKQYSKEEYETLVPKIIEHMRKDGPAMNPSHSMTTPNNQVSGSWGEFFPMSVSTTSYNHSLASRYFPIPKEKALAAGLQWMDKDTHAPVSSSDIPDLPDQLPASDEPIVAKSNVSGRPFRITTQEIKRYRRFHAPLPRMTYDERMEERSKSLGGVQLYESTCARSGKPILTTYPPDSPWIIWDRDVYEQEFGS